MNRLNVAALVLSAAALACAGAALVVALLGGPRYQFVGLPSGLVYRMETRTGEMRMFAPTEEGFFRDVTAEGRAERERLWSEMLKKEQEGKQGR